jgi:ABC-type phosphate transport system permease subunit
MKMGVPTIAVVIPYIIFGIFFITGLINFINPRLMWNMTESWKATKEPPKSFFIFRRIIGLIVMLIPIVFFCVMFYLSHND